MGEIRNTRSEPRSDALHSEEDRRVVYALQGSGKTSQRANGCGWGADVCFTLNATDVHGVCYIKTQLEQSASMTTKAQTSNMLNKEN